jgi:hypothetical protein
MHLGSVEFTTVRQLPSLGMNSLASGPRVPTQSEGSVFRALNGEHGRLLRRMRRLRRRAS